jgi:hypothetical protein
MLETHRKSPIDELSQLFGMSVEVAPENIVTDQSEIEALVVASFSGTTQPVDMLVYKEMGDFERVRKTMATLENDGLLAWQMFQQLAIHNESACGLHGGNFGLSSGPELFSGLGPTAQLGMDVSHTHHDHHEGEEDCTCGHKGTCKHCEKNHW